MEENTQHFWHVMLYYFKKGKNTREMQTNICAVYGEGAVTDRTCQSGLRSLCWGLLTGWCSTVGRPVEVDSCPTETWIENSQHDPTQEIADILKICQLIKLLMKILNVPLFYGFLASPILIHVLIWWALIGTFWALKETKWARKCQLSSLGVSNVFLS